MNSIVVNCEYTKFKECDDKWRNLFVIPYKKILICETLSHTDDTITQNRDAVAEVKTSTDYDPNANIEDSEDHFIKGLKLKFVVRKFGQNNKKTSNIDSLLHPKNWVWRLSDPLDLYFVDEAPINSRDNLFRPTIYLLVKCLIKLSKIIDVEIFGDMARELICNFNQDLELNGHLSQTLNYLRALSSPTQDPLKYLTIMNPIGGKGEARKIFDTLLCPIFRDVKIATDVHLTQHSGHAFNLLRYEMTNKNLNSYQGIIVVGGDGTLNEIISALIDRHNEDMGIDITDSNVVLSSPPFKIGIIPTGSTNATAFSLYGCSDPITAALHIAIGQILHFDVGMVHHTSLSKFSSSIPAKLNNADRPFEESCFTNNRRSYFLSLLAYGFLGDILAVFQSNSEQANENKTDIINGIMNVNNQKNRTSPKNNSSSLEGQNKISEGIASGIDTLPENKIKISRKLNALIKPAFSFLTKGPGRYNLAAAKIILCSNLAYPCTLIFKGVTGPVHITGHPNPLTPGHLSAKIKTAYKDTFMSHRGEDLCVTPCNICNAGNKLDSFTRIESEAEHDQIYYDLIVKSGLYDSVIIMPISGRCFRTRLGVSPLAHMSNGLADLILVKPSHANSRCRSRIDFLKYLLRVVKHHKNPFDLPYVEVYRINNLILFPALIENSVDICDVTHLLESVNDSRFEENVTRQCHPNIYDNFSFNSNKYAFKKTEPDLKATISEAITNKKSIPKDLSRVIKLIQSRIKVSDDKSTPTSSWNCDGELIQCPSLAYKVHRKLLKFYSCGPERLDI
ncbi:uncharacterized protein LOC135931897 isoform X2 [Gordionus sp. m RMFG-2023]|uniref:uncharacterized protein LOC135931897 isoform X2 n=1 Tax=Gordionus sp. m RMFG-2023 TaxID=3053472 RepID=UPI0031FD4A7B